MAAHTFHRGTPTNEHLFSYTSGRFLFNEDRRRQERYVEFDVEAFKELAAQGIEPGHGKVAHIAKFAEGGFNRVFLLTMDDGFQAIAKIPYKIALPKRHATASEAATLELLRLKGIPVPKLYSYSASVDNPAGVEYIIMEKVNGVPIETRWLSMTKRERHTLASSFVRLRKSSGKVSGKLAPSPLSVCGCSAKLVHPHQERPNNTTDAKSTNARRP
uniref:Aminoglycoside phosphotransferase domain-containing protein n=1 Tax=Coccidioides posadasii RMSCC 3488 TaxID=454284 RepID=A0A0J6F4U3_COCPO|nr:hypothetical protein CPAG_00346 [Coccidioides posadasii RMSCC 3488]